MSTLSKLLHSPATLLICCAIACVGELAAQGVAYHEAKQAFARRNYERAFELFQKAAAENPGDGNSFFYMGYIQDQRGRRADAIQYYRRAVDGRTDRDLKEKSFWKLVLYYKDRRDWDNLLVYSEKFLQFRDIGEVRRLRDLAEQNRDPRATESNRLMRQGQEKLRAGDVIGATSAFAAAVNALPENDAARWELALALMEQKNYAQAEPHLRRLIDRRPGEWEPAYKAAICNINLKRSDAALVDLETARERNGNPSASFIYFVNLAEGRIHLDRENYVRADALLREALRRRPTPTVAAALAFAEWGQGKTADADRRSREALAQDSALGDALFVQADLGARAERDEAYAVAARLLAVLEREYTDKELPARYAYALLHLGRKATQRQDYSLAIRAYERVNIQELIRIYEAERAAQATRNSLVDYNFYFGAALLRSGQLERAITHLTRVDRSAQADYMLAQAYAAQNNVEQTQQRLARAAAENPRYWDEARTEPALKALADRNAAFARFVQLRGVVEPAPDQTPAPSDPTAPR